MSYVANAYLYSSYCYPKNIERLEQEDEQCIVHFIYKGDNPHIRSLDKIDSCCEDFKATFTLYHSGNDKFDQWLSSIVFGNFIDHINFNYYSAGLRSLMGERKIKFCPYCRESIGAGHTSTVQLEREMQFCPFCGASVLVQLKHI